MGAANVSTADYGCTLLRLYTVHGARFPPKAPRGAEKTRDLASLALLVKSLENGDAKHSG